MSLSIVDELTYHELIKDGTDIHKLIDKRSISNFKESIEALHLSLQVSEVTIEFNGLVVMKDGERFIYDHEAQEHIENF